ncbi:DUF4102 domain-containing protein [Sulfitobacter sp. TSTF-M16]|uniref:DUF4102 domain-containing protein n=2 Tax=Sulfitobacter aestuariivivens TaxID=2766981 RepID=A0A927HGS4_9RHOB|nr:Arm DNA-binding domain-containing protein [Sulfitobacter aestuariivivens]MBD3665798.1 DUF4102 domain-containing protein [Sulfitobacter aestuariivivens]
MTETNARHALPGRHPAGPGLVLCVAEDGNAVWLVQGGTDTKERVLGRYPEMSVKVARQASAKWRLVARRGIDPEAEQEKARAEAARNLHQFYC